MITYTLASASMSYVFSFLISIDHCSTKDFLNGRTTTEHGVLSFQTYSPLYLEVKYIYSAYFFLYRHVALLLRKCYRNTVGVLHLLIWFFLEHILGTYYDTHSYQCFSILKKRTLKETLNVQKMRKSIFKLKNVLSIVPAAVRKELV